MAFYALFLGFSMLICYHSHFCKNVSLIGLTKRSVAVIKVAHLDLVCEVIKLITLIRVFVLSVYLSCNKSMFCVWNYENLMTH